MKTTVQNRKQRPIYYPDTDGKPIAEGDSQRKSLTYLVEALNLHFQVCPNIYVSGNLLIYYEEGNPKKSVAPDVFVVFGVPKHPRKNYKMWVEGRGPDVVIEVTSRITQDEDERVKPALYQQWGVREYFLHDPTGDYLKPALRGQRLNKQGQYEPMKAVQGLDGSVILTSTLLGLQLRLESGRLRLFDPRTNKYWYTYSEAVTARRLEEQWAEAERQRVKQAESQVQLERQRADRLAAQLRVLGIDPDMVVSR
jgi:Uma2 family endonuclease